LTNCWVIVEPPCAARRWMTSWVKRAADAAQVDAVVRRVALVLDGDDRRAHERRDVVVGDEHAVLVGGQAPDEAVVDVDQGRVAVVRGGPVLRLVLQGGEIGGDGHHHPEHRGDAGQQAQRHEDHEQPQLLQARATGLRRVVGAVGDAHGREPSTAARCAVRPLRRDAVRSSRGRDSVDRTPIRRALRLPSSRMADPSQSAAFLTRNTVDALPAGGLEARLAACAREGRPLRVKLGLDPTAPDLHLGHTVVLQKLREFQDLGHRVVLIVGDYTARVGDPSGRSATRPALSGEEIDANAETYKAQAFKVLRSEPELLEVRRNAEWLDMRMEELFRLARTTTVAQLLERNDFAKRFAGGSPISVLELFYPLMQGYDSVAITADVELGGTDQTFNLMLGRDVQRAYGVPEQSVLTLPLLVGTDGTQKMSKSLGNHVGVTEAPSEMYGKTLSLPDEAMAQWFELLAIAPPPPGTGPPRHEAAPRARDRRALPLARRGPQRPGAVRPALRRARGARGDRRLRGAGRTRPGPHARADQRGVRAFALRGAPHAGRGRRPPRRRRARPGGPRRPGRATRRRRPAGRQARVPQAAPGLSGPPRGAQRIAIRVVSTLPLVGSEGASPRPGAASRVGQG
jgi:tyrosyl-tRNA synthetase